ncbi:MMPL family transporter [Streptomyces phaeochromogenes]|uniref:MMPL family transporter n=1 Tax=Streptomyces phaeochromogenes TaxID=1923 RepID=A0ABZ1HHT3_STRPH|nr:MMPL family transporter [Streptomyces phaeochromogenes]MCX5597221.1 MMPL family transporter [Streptomyces phaeochromogenes]WSD18172.1 MMPL family transporter [Streptomyces phaeochromogenes]
MATFLYRLGRFSFRRRRLVLMLWIAVLAAVGIGAAGVSSSTSDTFAIPGTQSQKALDLLEKEFPQASADGATARVVFEAPAGQKLTSAAHKAEVESLVGDLKSASQVANVVDPYTGGTVSKDGSVAYAQVTYKVAQADVTDAARADLEHVAEQGERAGLAVSMGGTAVNEESHQSAAELIGIVIAALVMVITFGSLVAAGLPLLTALFGVLAAICGITVATSFIDLSSSTSTLALMLGLAVAIDYALFIVSRYRGELKEGHDPEEAAGRALGTAGSAVVFAGLTVVIALAGLSVIGIKILSDIGLGAAFAVVVAVVIALTLLPAMLGFAGGRISAGKLKTRRMRAIEQGEREPMGVRWARFVLRNPVKVLGVSVAGLLLLAIPALSLQLGMPGDSTATPGSTQRIAYDTVTDGFGAGYNGPLTVVVDARGSDDPKAAAQDAVTLLDDLPDVASVSPVSFNETGDVALIRAVPGSSPTSEDTVGLVSDIRDRGAALHDDTGAELMVTGTTALNIDISGKLNDALIPYLCVVVGLALILLMLVFRSILVPLKAAAGFLLSVLATLGVVVAVFQWGWLADVFGVDQTGPIVSVLPIFMVGVVFGLAMDYQVFLVTRMREEYVHGAEPKEAVIAGFRHGARVVTAAAVIMISVFAGFLFSDTALIKSIGLGLAAAVFFDAFVVRMTIVPAVMALLGRRAWALPGRLDRILPNVDVEGEKLRHLLEEDTERTEGDGIPEPVHTGKG